MEGGRAQKRGTNIPRTPVSPRRTKPTAPGGSHPLHLRRYDGGTGDEEGTAQGSEGLEAGLV